MNRTFTYEVWLREIHNYETEPSIFVSTHTTEADAMLSWSDQNANYDGIYVPVIVTVLGTRKPVEG